jgi:hypothetical protein
MMLSYNETPQDDAEWRCFFGAEGSGGPGLKAIHARMRPRREDPLPSVEPDRQPRPLLLRCEP